MTYTIDKTGDGKIFLFDSTSGNITGEFSHIEILEDGTEFSVLTNGKYSASPGKDPKDRVWNKGDVIRGLTTSFTCSAGEGQAVSRL